MLGAELWRHWLRNPAPEVLRDRSALATRPPFQPSCQPWPARPSRLSPLRL